ncbi:MAG: diguanylate cyclase [Mariprofundaceae bacterium]
MAIVEQKIDIPRFSRRLALLFFPALFLLLAVFYYAYQSEVEANRAIISEHEFLTISQHEKELEDRFKNIISDLLVLSEDNDLNHMLDDPDDDIEEHIYALNNEYPILISHKKIYDQVRLIDQAGQEIIRVEKEGDGAYLVPEKELQNKASRYYFNKTMALEPKNIFISPFDLNVEHGKIEKPLKPMIRFAVPITDHEENKLGMLILNYLGNNLLKTIEDISITSTGKAILLNSDGYWLKGLKPEDEWGFMYPDKKDRVFSAQYGDAWKQISAEESGQFVSADGMFTFITIRPLSGYSSNAASSSDYHWKLISFIPTETLNGYADKLKKNAIVLFVLLALVWFVASIIIAYEREKDHLHELAIQKKDAAIRDIVDTAFDAIITINQHGIISSFNPAARQMFGYEEHEAIGNNINMIVPSPHREMHDDYLTRYITTREAHIIKKPREVEAVKKDGSTFPVELCVGAKELGKEWLFTGIIRDITERKQMKAKLEKMATTDALTGLFNRGHFNRAFENEYRRSTRYDLPLSLIIMDADHFKSVNDNYGHPAGDAFLIALAKEISGVAREVDIVARYGGEEFVVILPQTGGKDAMIMAERLREAIEAMKITFEDHTISRTASIGVVSLQNVPADSPDDLLKAADSALYRAKDGGRNRVEQA